MRRRPLAVGLDPGREQILRQILGAIARQPVGIVGDGGNAQRAPVADRIGDAMRQQPVMHLVGRAGAADLDRQPPRQPFLHAELAAHLRQPLRQRAVGALDILEKGQALRGLFLRRVDIGLDRAGTKGHRLAVGLGFA